MSSTALSRLLTARAKALQPASLPITSAAQVSIRKDYPRSTSADSDLTTIWNSGEIIAERLVLGRKVVVTYCVNKN
jgi:hypothetical protein